MLRYRLITGPILIVLLLAVLTLDNRVDSVQLHGVWQDLFRGKEHPPRAPNSLKALGLPPVPTPGRTDPC